MANYLKINNDPGAKSTRLNLDLALKIRLMSWDYVRPLGPHPWPPTDLDDWEDRHFYVNAVQVLLPNENAAGYSWMTLFSYRSVGEDNPAPARAKFKELFGIDPD